MFLSYFSSYLATMNDGFRWIELGHHSLVFEFVSDTKLDFILERVKKIGENKEDPSTNRLK